MVLETARILLESLLEALEGALGPVPLEVAQPELEDRLLRLGRQPERFFEVLNGARELPLLPKDVAKEDVRRRRRCGVDREGQFEFRLVPPREVRAERPEGEVREEGVGLALDRAPERRLRGVRVADSEDAIPL